MDWLRHSLAVDRAIASHIGGVYMPDVMMAVALGARQNSLQDYRRSQAANIT
ncbi:MAG: hypothetical protein AB8B58_02655 [Roseobacter sp.]